MYDIGDWRLIEKGAARFKWRVGDRMESILALLFILLGVLFVVGTIMQLRLIKALKIRHREVWDRLGRPSMLMDSSMRQMLSLTKFISSGCVEVKDESLRYLCRALRLVTVSFLICFSLYVVMFIWLIISEQGV